MTASRVAVPVTDVLADVTIIDREVLDQAAQTSLRELLGQQAGVQWVSNGSYRSSTGLFLRGATSTQTIVLIDGVRVGSATSGTAGLENMPLNRIERIEILRGAASALYGPDAVGGVVQIFTREPTDELQLSASAGAGSDGQVQSAAAMRGMSGSIGYSLGVSSERASGINVTTNPASSGYNADADSFSSTSVDAKLVAKLNREHKVTLGALQSQTTYRFDGTPSPNPLSLTKSTSDAQAKPVLKNTTLQWEADWLATWKSTVLLGASSEESVNEYYRISDGAFGGSSQFNTSRRQVSWQNDFKIGADVASLILESRNEAVNSSTAYTVSERTLRGTSLSYAFNRSVWNALVVARKDENSQFGSFDNWALSAGYLLTQGLRAVGSVGTSFQAPTFNQLYFPGFGTPSLTPQTNKSSELGLKYNKGNVSWSAIAYNNEIQGFIVPSTNVQSSMAVLNGATLSAQIAQGNTTYAVSYDYADPHAYTTTARAKDLRFVRVAQHIVQLRANHRLQEVSVFGEFKYSSSREDAKVVGTGRDTLPEYTLLNLGAQWHFRKNWSTLARLNNATDTKYMLANGFSMPGANLFVSLNWTQ